MTTSTGSQSKKNDIFWTQLDDSIQRLGELSISDKILTPEKNDMVDAWDQVRQWRREKLPPELQEKLVNIFLSDVLKKEQEANLSISDEELLQQKIQTGAENLDTQKILARCIQSLGQQKLSYWTLIPWKDIWEWHQYGVPESARESVMGLQEVVLTGLEQDLKMSVQEIKEKQEALSQKDNSSLNTPSFRPQLQMFREVYINFYEDILEQDVKAIFEAEEEMANSNLIIGQQIYRVRMILAVYSQRKFLEWLKGICCKICNISWRKAYDLMYAYESRRFVEQNQPNLLPTFDFQLQRFQCEARRFKENLIPVLESAKEENKRYTLDEVRELFPSEKEKPPEEKHVNELRLSLKKLLDESLVSDLSRYIQAHPGETFQSILDVALRNWLTQQT